MAKMLVSLAISIAGLWVAGLINYLADVLPSRRKLVKPFCLNCNATMPVLNYFIWPRRCFHCGNHRRLRVWLVELLIWLSTIALWLSPPVKIGFLAGWILLAYLVLVFVIDLEHRLILHRVSLFGVLISVPIGTLAHGWRATLIGGVAGFAGMLTLYLLGKIFVLAWRHWQSAIEAEALGFGDVNLGAITGLLLGWPGIIAGLLLAILIAGVIAFIYVVVLLAIRRFRAATVLPYGPAMVAAIVFLLYL